MPDNQQRQACEPASGESCWRWGGVNPMLPGGAAPLVGSSIIFGFHHQRSRLTTEAIRRVLGSGRRSDERTNHDVNVERQDITNHERVAQVPQGRPRRRRPPRIGGRRPRRRAARVSQAMRSRGDRSARAQRGPTSSQDRAARASIHATAGRGRAPSSSPRTTAVSRRRRCRGSGKHRSPATMPRHPPLADEQTGTDGRRTRSRGAGRLFFVSLRSNGRCLANARSGVVLF
jgi:hypothetical protein